MMLDILKTYVESFGHQVFIDFEPPEPNEVVIINEYPGMPTPLQEEAVHRSIQIVTRSTNSSTAYNTACDLFEQFSPVNRYKEIGDDWFMFYPRQTPFKLKYENDRFYYCFNLGVTTELRR